MLRQLATSMFTWAAVVNHSIGLTSSMVLAIIVAVMSWVWELDDCRVYADIGARLIDCF